MKVTEQKLQEQEEVMDYRPVVRATCDARTPMDEESMHILDEAGRRRVYVTHEDVAYSEASGHYFCLNCGAQVTGWAFREQDKKSA